MFSRDRATEIDDFPHDACDGALREPALLRVAAVVHDVHVKISVGGVAENRRRKPRFARHFPHSREQGEVIFLRHDNVFVQFGICDPEHRRRARTAHFPERLSLGGIARFEKRAGIVASPLPRRRSLRFHARRVAIVLDEQDGISPRQERKRAARHNAATCRFFRPRAIDRKRVHKFENRWCETFPHERAGGIQRGFVGRKCAEKCAPRLGQRNEAQNDFRHDAESALRANPEVAQVISGGKLLCCRAPAHFFSRGQKSFEREDVVARHAVFRGAQAAGVCRDIPADCAVLHARGIRRKEKPKLRGEIVYFLRYRARAYDGNARVGFDFAVRPFRKRHRPTATDRRRRARGRCPRTANSDGDAVRIGEAERCRDIVVARGKNDGVRRERELYVVQRGCKALCVAEANFFFAQGFDE